MPASSRSINRVSIDRSHVHITREASRSIAHATRTWHLLRVCVLAGAQHPPHPAGALRPRLGWSSTSSVSSPELRPRPGWSSTPSTSSPELRARVLAGLLVLRVRVGAPRHPRPRPRRSSMSTSSPELHARVLAKAPPPPHQSSMSASSASSSEIHVSVLIEGVLTFFADAHAQLCRRLELPPPLRSNDSEEEEEVALVTSRRSQEEARRQVQPHRAPVHLLDFGITSLSSCNVAST